MSIERVFHCDGPECDRHVRTAGTRPTTFLAVAATGEPTLHFCGWDCVLRFAASKEPETVISGSSSTD